MSDPAPNPAPISGLASEADGGYLDEENNFFRPFTRRLNTLDDPAAKERFQCSSCGACCRNLRVLGDSFADLDDGHGVCKYYDAASRLCSVYAIRPVKCRVEEAYGLLRVQIDFEDYLAMTELGCKILQQK